MYERPSDILWEKEGRSYYIRLNIICSRDRYVLVLRASPIENRVEERVLGVYLKEEGSKVFGNLKRKFDIEKLSKYFDKMYYTINWYCSSEKRSESDFRRTLDLILKCLSNASRDKKLSIDLKREKDELENDRRTLGISYYM